MTKKMPLYRRPIRIKDFAQYAQAVEQLEKLNAALAEASRNAEVVKRKINRSEELKRSFDGSMSIFGQMTEDVFDDIARKVAETGVVPEQLMRRLQRTAPNRGFQPENVELGNEVGDALRSVALFKRAIELQEREIKNQRKLAIFQACADLHDERNRIARKVAEAALIFAEATGEEKNFFESQDEEVSSALTPPVFPAVSFFNSQISQWIGLVLGLPESEIQARVTNPAPPADSAAVGR